MAVKIAGVQMDIAFANAPANLEKIHGRLKETTSAGAALTVFPECTTTGYCFESFEEAFEQSQDMDGDSIKQVRQMCADLNTRAVFGFLERSDKQLFNSVALVSGEGVIGHYRKIHLPFLGVDRFTTSGSCADAVFAAGDLQVGLNICYDSSFPEAARSLALAGADLIALPTNWPPAPDESLTLSQTPGHLRTTSITCRSIVWGQSESSSLLAKVKSATQKAASWPRPTTRTKRLCMPRLIPRKRGKSIWSPSPVNTKFIDSTTATHRPTIC